MADFDPVLLQQQMDKLNSGGKQYHQTIAILFKMIEDNIGSLESKGLRFSDKLKGMIGEVGKEADAMLELNLKKTTIWGERIDAVFDKMKRQIHDLEREPGMKMLFGNPEGPGALSGKSGSLTNLMGDMRSQMMSGLAAGGMIGLLLTGANKDEEFRAVGEQIGQLFNQVSENTGGAGAALAEFSRNLEKAGQGTRQEVSQVVAAFTAGGASVEQAMSSVLHPMGDIKGSLVEATLALDKLYEVSAGSSAQMAVQLARDTGQELNESVDTLTKIGAAARESGMNFQMFAGTIAQVSSSLRLQRQDVQAVSDTYLKFYSSVRSAFPGASSEFSAETAKGALTGIASGISNLSDGWKAKIGEMVTGGRVRGADAIFGFETGFKNESMGKGFDFMTASLDAIRKTFNLDRMSTGERSLALRSAGFDRNSANVLAEFTGDAVRGGTEKALEKHRKELDGIFGKEAAKKTATEVLLTEIQDTIAHIGSAILATLLSLVQLISGGFQAAVSLVAHPTEAPTLLRRMNATFDTITGALSDKWSDVGKGISGTASAGANVMKNILGNEIRTGFGLMSEEDTKTYEKAQRKNPDKKAVSVSLSDFAPGKAVQRGIIELMVHFNEKGEMEVSENR